MIFRVFSPQAIFILVEELRESRGLGTWGYGRHNCHRSVLVSNCFAVAKGSAEHRTLAKYGNKKDFGKMNEPA